MIEVRRHALRAGAGEHLSAAGVRDARRLGEMTGPFDVVVTSAATRAVETAVAMGFAVDDTPPWLDPADRLLAGRLAAGSGFGAFAKARRDDASLARVADQAAQALAKLARRSHVLAITHAGLVELIAVALAPNADHRSWGGGCRHLEGVRLHGDGTVEVLRHREHH